MRYIMTFFWSIALVSMLNYVAGAIANIPVFDFTGGVVVAVIAALLVIFLGESMPEGEIADH